MNSIMRLETAVTEPSMLQVVLMGIITVFVVLICLIILIKILGAIMVRVTGKSAPAPAPAPVPAAKPVAVQPNNQQIVAAIAEEMGTDVNHLKIHSIRRL